MNKPKPINSKPYYDLISVLKYVDDKIPKFHKKIWRELCEIGYINNDTVTGIGWDAFVHENADKDIINGIDYMFSEFPDIKNGDVDFSISW